MSDENENQDEISAPSPPAPAPTAIKRNEKGQLIKGFATLNPKGRPKGSSFQSRLRAATNDGQDVIDTISAFARPGARCSPRDSIEAGKWIIDRIEGKQHEVKINVDGDAYLEHLAEVSEADLVALARAPLPSPQNLPQLVLGESSNPAEEQEPTG